MNNTMMCIFMTLMSIMIGINGFNVVLMMYDPFYYHSVVALTPKVPRGGRFVEELDVSRNRICKVEVDRYIVNDETTDVFFRERTPAGATPLGRTRRVRNTVPIPKDAPLGPATMIQNVHSHCIDGMHSMSWPTIKFEVTE